mmetsp:Transcript_58594/g.154860  ORF Transcript_58594/g.154860 Transcript_58594/m.154860 type:complete len:255 (+) Transcript_58594:2822-3586(+)
MSVASKPTDVLHATSKGSPRRPVIVIMAVSLPVFEAYFKHTAYDFISSGQFKRHLGSARDGGEKWASVMYSRYNEVRQKIRDVGGVVSEMTNPLNRTIQGLCRDVMTCAQPPVRLQAGLGTCVITGETCEHCLDLTRPGKEGGRQVLVHNRFWYFFVFLWYCSKLEYIIRSCTRQWMTSSGVSVRSSNYMPLCEEFSRTSANDVELMHQLFNKGWGYVTESLQRHCDKYVSQAVLCPPPEFFLVGSENTLPPAS